MPDSPESIGLCLRCVHARQVPSRTSLYWRCALAEVDPRFERYPRLPVLRCAGFEAGEPPAGRTPQGPDVDPSEP